MSAFVKNSSGVIFPVFKYLNPYVTISTIGFVYPSKVPSSTSMTLSENFKFNTKAVKRYLPKTMSYMPLAESSTWKFYTMVFIALISGKVHIYFNHYIGSNITRLHVLLYHSVFFKSNFLNYNSHYNSVTASTIQSYSKVLKPWSFLSCIHTYMHNGRVIDI